MKYQYTKNISDAGFYKLVPRIEFFNNFSQEFELIYETEESFYQIDKLFSNIEQFFIDKNIEFSKKEYFTYVNENKDIVINECIYIDKTNFVVFAFKSTFDADSYKYSPIPIEIDLNVDDDFDKNRYELCLEVYGFNKAKPYIQNFLSEFISKDIKPTKKTRELNIIAKNEYGLTLKSFPTIDNLINIDTHYNDDFKVASEIIVNRLNKKDSNGIVLLSGIKGSGKTNYLRYLTSQITEKKIIYISPDMSSILSDPEFISFMLLHTNSILIIEDAENVLKPRKSGGSQAVSNLLNLSDGLLGDALKIQILCTFNCDVKEIDDALLRPGRLIVEYNFDKLNPIKSSNLLKSLYGEGLETNKPLTLAEIYNYKDKLITSSKVSTIGFKNN